MKFREAFELIALFLIISPVPALANCKNPISQMEMNICSGEDFERADKALNIAYKKYRSGLPENQKALLKEAQTSWIKFRDSACKFEASAVEGGSMQPMVNSACLTDYTKQRLKRINDLSKCKLAPNPGKGCDG